MKQTRVKVIYDVSKIRLVDFSTEGQLDMNTLRRVTAIVVELVVAGDIPDMKRTIDALKRNVQIESVTEVR